MFNLFKLGGTRRNRRSQKNRKSKKSRRRFRGGEGTTRGGVPDMSRRF